MKILHTNCDYIWTPLHQLMVNELNTAGVQNIVFSPVCTTEGKVIELTEDEFVCKCFSKNDRLLFHHKQTKIISAFENRFSNQMNSGSIDILHSYYLFTDGYYTRKMALKYNIPYVVAVRNTDVNTFFKYMPHLRHVGVNVMRDAARVFFLSESYRKYVIESCVPKKFQEDILKKSIVIPNGIDEFWLSNLYLSRDYESIRKRLTQKELRIVFAGGINKNKNIGLIVSAVKLLRREGWDVQLEIVGAVIEQPAYDEIKNIPGVSYTDKLPKEELIKKYREADIFVMPSHRESFGLVYAEAMSQGLPVLYTRGQGFDKQFPEGTVGFSVNDKEPSELAHRISSIAEDYSEISKSCVELVRKFDWDKIVQQYIDIYQHILLHGNKC